MALSDQMDLLTQLGLGLHFLLVVLRVQQVLVDQFLQHLHLAQELQLDLYQKNVHKYNWNTQQ